MAMPRLLAMFGLLVMAVACAPGAQTPKPSPVAKASPSPTEPPTPSPSPPPLQITAASFHGGEIGFGYAPASPTATGGVPPYSWSVAGGALPAGLVMDSSAGAVSGTPTALGASLFTVQVSDTTAATATIDTTINVVKRLVASPTCPTNFPCMVEAGCVTVCGGFANQDGGMPPYTYHVVAGGIPSGMGLNAFTLTRAFPAPAAGSTTDWVFTVRVTDGLGATAQTTAKFHVFPHIALSSALTPTSCMFATGAQCIFKVTYTLGTPGLQAPPVSVSLSILPPNVANAPKPIPTPISGNGTASVSVPPPACLAANKGVTYSWTLTVYLSDSNPCGPAASQMCSTVVAKAKLTLTC